MNITRVHGGQLNRLWRFDTDDGSFAVKELNNERGWTYRFDDVFRFEQAAFAAGIPMPQPIAANETVLIHRWVEGEKVPDDRPVSPAFAAEIGTLLARLHAIGAPWTHVSIPDPMPTEDEWRSLAERAADQTWGADLAAAVPAFGAIGRFFDEAGQPEPMVLTHKDLSQKNLLSVDGHPCVIDWECSGVQPLAMELGSTAYCLSTGHGGGDRLQPEVFGAVLDGYVDGGGTLPDPGPHWFADQLGGWTWFTQWNIERCLAGVEPASGPSLAIAHDVASTGIRDLPRLFARIDELAELTVR